ncbi:LmeA family phospholipid-binding protein [Streptomyces sp. NPDC020801]|uniref:LmeA family phospholipid-binding protein n=1 Tax=Streptomyces sp. NPDC020801 TaxID=3365093 RepID=UPI0037B9B4CA
MNRRHLVIAVSAAVLVAATSLTGSVALTHRAEQRIADAAACRLAPVGDVSATLDNPLAAVTMLRGAVGDVDVHAEHLRRGGMSMALDAHLRGVRTDGATHGGSATVTVPYSQLAKRLDRKSGNAWTLGTDGRGLTLTGVAGPLGVPVTVHTDMALRARALVVTPTEVTILGRTVALNALPGSTADTALAQRLKPRSFALPALPSGVRPTVARAGASGLTVHLALPSATAGTTASATAAHAEAAGRCAAL